MPAVEPVMELVISLFPGADLLSKPFEADDRCIVRGPDLLTGGNIVDFHLPANTFAGMIGGPPCLAYSRATFLANLPHDTHVDYIPDFVRLWFETGKPWVVMENVPEAEKCLAIPQEWNKVILRDWDCGGKTIRRRAFWTWPFAVPTLPPRDGEDDAFGLVVASGHRASAYGTMGMATGTFLPGTSDIDEVGLVQGFPELGEYYMKLGLSKKFAWRLLGNGVPLAMGKHVAKAQRNYSKRPNL